MKEKPRDPKESLFDKVLYKGQECFISGRRTSGYFKLIKLDGSIINNSAKYKELILVKHSSSYLIEERSNILRKEIIKNEK